MDKHPSPESSKASKFNHPGDRLYHTMNHQKQLLMQNQAYQYQSGGDHQLKVVKLI